MKKILVVLLLCCEVAIQAQELPVYTVFNKKAKSVNYGKMLRQLGEADVILFGEQHNDAVVHWLQLQLVKSLHGQSPLVLGAEMFESDNQVILNEYLAGVITHQHFTTEAKVWKNYQTDYKPLLDFAKENQLPFIATNIPRRYASLVNREGLEGLTQLSAEAKKWVAPLPIEVDLTRPGYAWMIETMGSHAPGDPANIAKAQASKDATMAYFIAQNLEADKKFIHFHGTFHSNNFQGIYDYLKASRPDLKIMTIASVNQLTTSELEEKNKTLADFTIVTPADGPKSY
ncbi:MAG: hypothetical protein Roseis2KO_58610 [Roseivirga sp.]